MKVTFIQPYYHNIFEALGLGYIIAYVKKHYQGELEINFFQRKFDDFDTVVNGSRDSDIVAFSCTSPAYADGLRIAHRIKQLNPKIHIVFGGWHPTALPREVIKEDCVDQVIVGEGEQPMLEIIQNLSTQPIVGPSPRLRNVANWVWPDRATVRNNRTIDLCEKMNGYRTASFQMNRGCKVHCKFCAEQGMTGKYNRVSNPIRSRRIRDVLGEIDAYAQHYDIDYFKFVDATFDVDADSLIKFCMAKTLMDNRLQWECNIHPGFVQDEKVFEYLRLSHCNQINIGVESGSPRILKDIGKGTRIEHIKNVFKWARKYGIKRRGFFLLGMPNETVEDLELTDELIDEIEPDVLGFTILAPFPGSDFYDHEKYKDVDWSAVGEYGNDIWETEHFSNAELKEHQRFFMDEYKDKLCEVQSGIV